MTFVPLVANGYTPTTQVLATIISAAVQAVLIIPLAVLGSKYAGQSVIDMISEKSKALGIITAFLYFAFFFCFTVNAVLHFQSFISSRFFPNANEYISVGFFLLICAYCAHLGISGLARSAVLLFLIFAVTLAAILITSVPSYDALNFYYDRSYQENLFNAVLDDMARNGEITALVLLSKHIKEHFSRASYGLIAAKPVLSLTAAFLIIGVLGEFAAVTDYPFLAVSSHAGIRFIGRSDSIFMVLWTITSVIAVSLMINLGSGLIAEMSPKGKYKCTFVSAAVFAAVMLFIKTGADFSVIYQYACSAQAVAVLVFVIPCLTLIAKRAKRRDAK